MHFTSPHFSLLGRHSGQIPVSPALPDNVATRQPRGSWLRHAAVWLLLLIAPLATQAQTVSAPILVTPLGNGGDGEVIAFNPNDGMIYHASGVSSNEVFEKINPMTNAVTPIVTPNQQEKVGLVWYPPLNVFLATTRNTRIFYHVTPTGTFTNMGTATIDLRGLAVVGTRVFAVNQINDKVYEINPANAAILSTTTILLDGNPIDKGISVTTDPVTGQVYAILEQGGARKIALLNVATGAATTLAVLGDNFSSLTFVNFGNSDLYGVTGDGNLGPLGPETLYRFTISGRTLPANLTVQASGRPNNVGLGDPAVCLDPGGLVGVAATVTNPNNAPLAATFMATLPGGLTAVAGTCTADVNPGGCTITANGGTVSWNGTLAAGQTVNIVYRARIDAAAGLGSSFTINNTATVGGAVTNLAYTFTLSCPLTNTRVTDQKAGSVLVFPYYTSTIGGGSDTRMTISNISNAASTAANQAYVHLFFIDGTTCNQADLFLCLTPNASFSFKASEYDPGNTGYLLAVAVDRNGVPVQNNVLIGNAFVTTPTLADNYGAESFWANTFAVATVTGNTATLYFDQTGYDAVPKQFVAEIQSPVDAAGQQIVTAGLSGNLTTSMITGAAQVGTGLAFNEQEKFVSFNGWLTGVCQARATIATNSPRVPNGLGNLINTGQSGSLKFNVGAAVGLLLTPRTATWKGIRTLHKTQTVTTSLTIPIFVPVC